MTLAELFAAITADASALDCLTIPGHPETGPAAIRAAIMGTHDRLPGSSRSSESGIRSARIELCEDPTCPQDDGWQHTHPVPNDPTGDAAMRPSISDTDLDHVDTAVATFVAMVGELVARSVSRGVPTTWDEAVGDAAMLDQMDAIGTLEQTWGHKQIRKWINRAGDALHDIEHVARRHVTRDPDDHERSWTSGLADEQCCRVCLQMGLRVQWQDGGATGLCQGCYRLRARCAAENGMEPIDVGDPPVTLVEELRRIGSPGSVNDRKARTQWFADVGAQQRHCA